MDFTRCNLKRTARRSALRAFAAVVIAYVLHTSGALGAIAEWSAPDIDSYFYKHFSFGGQASYGPNWGHFEIDPQGNFLPPEEEVGASRHSQLLLAFQTEPEIQAGLPVSRYDVCFAEVKTYQPYFRESGNPNAPNVPIPTDAATVVAYKGDFKKDSGHTEWTDARSHQTGFTAVFAPNSVVEYLDGGTAYDVDFTSAREGQSTKLTYAAVTSRSHHAGIVNVAMVDGSVHAVSDDIGIAVWRGMATRSGDEATALPTN